MLLPDLLEHVLNLATRLLSILAVDILQLSHRNIRLDMQPTIDLTLISLHCEVYLLVNDLSTRVELRGTLEDNLLLESAFFSLFTSVFKWHVVCRHLALQDHSITARLLRLLHRI